MIGTCTILSRTRVLFFNYKCRGLLSTSTGSALGMHRTLRYVVNGKIEWLLSATVATVQYW